MNSNSEATKLISALTDIAEIKHYADRVGAVDRSLRALVVTENEGSYRRDIAAIRIGKDGTVEAPEGFEPTESEAASIKAACTGVQWPEPILLGKGWELPDELKKAAPEDLFELKDKAGQLIMIHQRIDRKDGVGKDYIPWSYWSDKKWRRLEPEGLLPLYGLEKIGDHTTAFIHEGAKAARAAQRLVNPKTKEEQEALKAHPWGVELSGAAHIGWIGGAPNPDRTDWSGLQKCGIERVYIVADNDAPGRAAVSEISKALARWSIAVMAVQFTDDFPAGFDLADPFPAKMFADVKGRRVYKGPSFSDQCRPATWMTVQNPPPQTTGRGRPPAPTYRLRKEAIGQWWLVAHEKKPLFIPQHDRTRFFTEEAFNTAVRPFSNVLNNAALLKQLLGVHVEAVAYEPGRQAGVITVDGRRSINTWTPTRIKPVIGDDAPWIKFLEHLFPIEQDRQEVMRWVATLAARPDMRMKYGLVLCSTMHGVGKTTLCEILKALVGPENASAPSATDIKSDYNDWFIRKRLIWVNEIYEGGSWTTYNKLKSFITDDDHLSHAKFEGRYPVKNWAHFVLCSNSTRPLSLEDDDRRFFVPQVTENKTLPGGWDAFHQWLNADGFGIILNWAREALETGALKPVTPGEHAPISVRKERMIAASRSEEETLVRELAMAAKALSKKEEGRQVVLVYDDIKSWLEVQMNEPLSRKQDFAFRRWIDRAGLLVPNRRFKVDGRLCRVAAVLSVPEELGWPELKQWHVMPETLLAAEM